LLTAEANLAQAGADVRQAERKVALAQRRLIKELGRRVFNALSAEGTFDVTDEPNDAPDFEMLADTTPLLKKLASEKEAARHNVSSSKANYWPSVYADANTGRSGDHWFFCDESWFVGVWVTLLLFDGLDREAFLKKVKF
jgi:outer membrane protein TolC